MCEHLLCHAPGPPWSPRRGPPAPDMLAGENSGFSVDASVRITLLDRDIFQASPDELPAINIHSL